MLPLLLDAFHNLPPDSCDSKAFPCRRAVQRGVGRRDCPENTEHSLTLLGRQSIDHHRPKQKRFRQAAVGSDNLVPITGEMNPCDFGFALHMPDALQSGQGFRWCKCLGLEQTLQLPVSAHQNPVLGRNNQGPRRQLE